MLRIRNDDAALHSLPREPDVPAAVPLLLGLEDDLSPRVSASAVVDDRQMSERLPAAPSRLGEVLKVSTLVLLGLLAMTQWTLWKHQGSLQQYWHMVAAVDRQSAENQRLLNRNQALAAEVLDLKQGLEAVEELARSEMGLVKQDETFFQVLAAESVERKQSD